MEVAWSIFIAVSFFYFVFINLHYTLLIILSFFAARTRVNQAEITNFKMLQSSQFTPPVSIIIPAHNEEEVIANSVHAALRVDYPEFEVIVVNDRSTDRTLRTLIEEFGLHVSDEQFRNVIPTVPVRRIYRTENHPNLVVVDKEHGGKADSLNMGVNVAQYPYICNTDADTIFEKDSILRIIRPVSRDPKRVVAIGGQVRVGNGFQVEDGKILQRRLPKQFFSTLQLVEYLRTFIANRVGWSAINAMLLISGAFGLWRRDVLVDVGGFASNITGEDLELTMRFHRLLRLRDEDFRVVSLPDPVCWTEVPEDVNSFIKQRNRWHRVLLESFNIHRDMLLNPFYGSVGMLAMPSYFFFNILGPFLEFFSYFFVAGAYAGGLIGASTLGTFLLLSIGYTTLLNTASILIEDVYYGTYDLAETLELLLVGLLDNLGYRQFTMFIRIWATFDWMGKIKGWGKISRYGFRDEDDEKPSEKTRDFRRQDAARDAEKEPSTIWELPEMIREPSARIKFVGRIAGLLSILLVFYFSFAWGTHYLFTPNLQVAGHSNPDRIVTSDTTVELTIRARNTRPFTKGAAFVVAVLEGDTEYEGSVVDVPPWETVSVSVDVPLKGGKNVYSLVLFDAWRKNLRVGTLQGLSVEVDTTPVQLRSATLLDEDKTADTVSVLTSIILEDTKPRKLHGRITWTQQNQTNGDTVIYRSSGPSQTIPADLKSGTIEWPASKPLLAPGTYVMRFQLFNQNDVANSNKINLGKKTYGQSKSS